MLHGEPVKFDPFFAAKIMSELLSEKYGHPVEIILTKKEPAAESPPEERSG